MKNNNCILSIGEIIEDFMSSNNLKEADFSKLIEEYGGSLSERQIRKWKSTNPPQSMDSSNLIALSQLTKIPIDDLLNNNLEEKRNDVLFLNELGLKSSTTAILKKYKTPSKKPLFKMPKKSIDSISELDIINHFISDVNLTFTFKEQIIKFIIEYKKLEKAFNDLKKNKKYFTEKDFKTQEKELKIKEKNLLEKLYNEIDTKTHSTVKKFINKQLSLLK